jgi:gluconolactonase
MNTNRIWVTVVCCGIGAAITLGQGQPPDPRRTAGVQAANDPNRPALIAQCKNPPAPPPAAGGRGAATASAESQDYKVTAIPGVIDAGQRWRTIWTGTGNNADGIVGLDDGSLLVAQNDNSAVMKIDRDGKPSVAYSDTYTGGALSMNSKGQLFVVQRSLYQAIWQLAPQRRLLANTYKGEPLDCLGSGLNDLTADSKGGVYFTMGGVYYANPQGVVMGRFGTVTGNGILLSRDEKILYVTGRVSSGTAAPGGRGDGGAGAPGGGAGIVAFDVQPDGSLTNERQFAEAGADGTTVDSEGRLYSTNPRGEGGVAVISPDGKLLGTIPTPRPVITAAFAGPDKKTLYVVANNRETDAIYAIQMVAQGFKGRAK